MRATTLVPRTYSDVGLLSPLSAGEAEVHRTAGKQAWLGQVGLNVQQGLGERGQMDRQYPALSPGLSEQRGRCRKTQKSAPQS